MFKKKAGKILSLIVAMGVAFSTIVTVTASAASSMFIGADDYNLAKGQSTTCAIYTEGGGDTRVSGVSATWSVTDPSAASITSHGSTATLTILKNNASFHINALVNGTTLVTDELVGAYDTYKEPSQITSITVNSSSLSLSGKGSTAQIKVNMTRSGDGILPGSLPDVISSNSNIAVGSLNSDWNREFLGGYVTITAKGNGSATITIKSSDGPSASCRVTVSGCGGSTTVTTNPKPSSPTTPTVGSTTTGHSAGTAAVNPATGNTVSPTGQIIAPDGTVISVSSTAGQSSSQSASSIAKGSSSASKGAVSGITDSTASSDVVTLASTKRNNSGNGPLVPVIVCISIGVLLGATAIVMFRVHRAKEKAEDPDDISSMDETAEIKIPSDSQISGKAKPQE